MISPGTPAHAQCANVGGAVTCGADDTDGFASTVDVDSITVNPGVTVDDTGNGGNGAAGGFPVGIIEIVNGGPGPPTPDVNGAITNDGTITDTGANHDAIFVEGAVAGRFTNTGTMSGGANALRVFSGTVDGGFENTGSMTGVTGNAVDVQDVNSGFTNSGTITGGNVGVDAVDITGGFTNTNTITGTGNDGINTGTISDTFDNSGTITGRGGDGIDTLDISGGFTNTGTIEGLADDGVFVDGTVSGGFTNTATITGSGGAGSDGLDILGSITGGFTNRGTIRGLGAVSGDGLDIGGDITDGFTNTGTITGSTLDGVGISGSVTGGFTNTGTITGGNDGVEINTNVTGTVDNSDTITGNGDDGFDIDGMLTGDFINSGTITGAGGDGVDIDGPMVGSFSNSGTIRATGPAGADSNAVDLTSITGSFTNTGTIRGTDAGVAVEGGTVAGGFENSGTILGNEGGAGEAGLDIDSVGGNTATFTNKADGEISGAIGIDSEAGVEDVKNAGTITGTGGTALDLGAGDDSLTLETGSTLNGTAQGGAGTDTFAISGAVTEDSDVLGFETFDFNGDGTSELSGTITTPTNTLFSGTLLMNGTLGTAGGTTTVQDDAILGGTGTVLGQVTVNDGATAAPGNSIGTLNVTGNITFEPGSRFEVEVNADGSADKIAATGTATITGGTVVVAPESGIFADETRYTILTADGGRTGTFDAVELTHPTFLSASLGYRSTSVLLSVSRIAFETAALTHNQTQVSAALDDDCGASSGALADLCAALFFLSADDARGVFDDLAGEIHPAGASANTAHLLNLARTMRDGALPFGASEIGAPGAAPSAAFALDRNPAQTAAFLAVRQAADAPRATHAYRTFAADLARTGKAAESPWRAWMRGFGSRGEVDGDGNGQQIDHWSGGAVLGLERRLAPDFLLGAAFSYLGGRTEITAQEMDTEGVALAALARRDINTGFGFDAVAGFVAQDFETERTLSNRAQAGSAHADYRARSVFLGAEGFYKRAFGSVVAKPFLGFDTVVTETESFTESDAGSVGLVSNGDTTASMLGRVGMAVSSEISIANGTIIVPSAAIAYAREFADRTPETDFTFIGGTTRFETVAAGRGRDRAELRAGFAALLTPSITANLAFDGSLSEDDQAAAITGGLRVVW